MREIPQAFSTSELVEAIEGNLFAAWTDLSHWPQVDFYDGPDMIRFISGVPYPLCNAVFGARMDSTDLDAQIEATMAHFKSRDLPMLWWTGPATQPFDLGEHLEAHGLTHADDVPGLAIDLSDLNENLSAPPGLNIQRIEDIQGLREWIAVFKVGFDMPDFVVAFFFQAMSHKGFASNLPFRHYIGLWNGKPVACSSVFEGAGVAGIYNVATVPYARRKGFGAAMSLLPLSEARAMGYRIGIVHATPIGLSVYRQLGFQEYCRLGIYAWQGETQGAVNRER